MNRFLLIYCCCILVIRKDFVMSKLSH